MKNLKHVKRFNESEENFDTPDINKNLQKKEGIIKWASSQKISAHDTLDDLENNQVIKSFYSDDCQDDESGDVLSLQDAEILAYEYARRLLASMGL